MITELPKKGEKYYKNESKRDNRFENLELLPSGAHTAHHNKESRLEPDPVLMCAWCGTKFTYPARNYRYHVKNGRKHFHCSRSCGAKRQHSAVV